ncbi:3-keto-5-aminohexanoate cleavage protein [Streptomyces natalensis]|uniref:3-keto-5-aminohexanoate cleavage protein n=1 Tax=Streptomyces natalensis TaxID=68242 RepID=UPI0005CA967D|nr:3-keto-5-aminohexanoate cleavage protein [Streptomyces natalensis]
MLQVCLNGVRTAADSAAVPLTPSALADAARQAVAAGAQEVHVHPKTPCGEDSLSPRVVGPVLEAIRAVVDVPVGVTTGAWADPDAGCQGHGGTSRARSGLRGRIASWTVPPDYASVNWHEPGADTVAAALLERGIGIEAGLWSGTDAAARFTRSPFAPRVLRILAEVIGPEGESARHTARELLAELTAAGHDRPVLLHGVDGGAWPVLRLAGELGLDTRIGLEDTLLLPDGAPAPDNARLIRAARALYDDGRGAAAARAARGDDQLPTG